MAKQGAIGNAKSMQHGIKNPGKVANKYDGWGTKKGSQSDSKAKK